MEVVSRPAADRQGKVLALIHHCLKVSGAKAAVRKKNMVEEVREMLFKLKSIRCMMSR